MLDELAIARLEQAWGLFRDTGRWDELRALYAPGATMKTTWFDGPALEFVDASARLSSKAGTLALHSIGATTASVRGARAVAEVRVVLLIRQPLEGVEVDVTCHGRFVDRLVRMSSDWLLLKRDPIYEKDSLASTRPIPTPPLDAMRLASFPAGYRHLAYMQSLGGASIVMNIVEHNSPAQVQLYAEAMEWLEAGQRERGLEA